MQDRIPQRTRSAAPRSLRRPPRASPGAAAFLAAALLAGCSGDAAQGLDGDETEGRASVAAGREAFVERCSGCHTSRDGIDLAFFGYPDSTIVRRALTHVSLSTARDIAAHIRSLGPARATRTARPFQPGDRLLAGDVEFAERLFGADAWPLDLTAAELAAIDPHDVAVALPLPRWSSEDDDTDWMADTPIDDALLDWNPGSPLVHAARTHLDAYYATRDIGALELALTALRDALFSETNATSPCRRQNWGAAGTMRTCFDALRWTAGLAGQHMLREGRSDGEVPGAFHRAWWDVGETLRHMDPAEVDIDGLVTDRAAWRYVGWLFAPGDDRRSVGYQVTDLVDLGLDRHAVFVALRAAVARAPTSVVPYDDVRQAADHAPDHWVYPVLRFGFAHLRSRLDAGEYPRDILYPRQDVDGAIAIARRRVTDPAGLAELEAMATDLRTRLLAKAGL